MSKRLNIGVYIGPDDLDIAAWFNLLRENKLSRAKWVKGLIAAYALDKSLDIGTISFASISTGEAPVRADDKYGYGWQIKGPNGEYVCGSVVNISIGKSEVVPILEEAWANNRHLATFVKALIRKHLKVADKAALPKSGNLKRVYSEFLVRENKKPLNQEKSVTEATTINQVPIEKIEKSQNDSAKVPSTPVVNPDPPLTPAKSSTPAFDFGGKKETRTKNPLSGYI